MNITATRNYVIRRLVNFRRLEIAIHTFDGHEREASEQRHRNSERPSIIIRLKGALLLEHLKNLTPTPSTLRALGWFACDDFYRVVSASPKSKVLCIGLGKSKGWGYLDNLQEGQGSFEPVKSADTGKDKKAPAALVIEGDH